MAGAAGSLLDGRSAAQDDQVGQRDPLAAFLRIVEAVLDACQCLEHLRQFLGIVRIPVRLRCQANARAVGAAAHVGAAEGRGGGPGGAHQLGDREP